MAVHFHEEDLPEGVLAPGPVAVDTETMGLVTPRDRLCLVQISDGQGDEHLVRFAPGSSYDAPNLKAVLADPARVKLYHFARFDLAAIEHYLGVMAAPVFCTKIASKLTRTYTDRHGLKDLVRELLGIEVSKQQQSERLGRPRAQRRAARLRRLGRALPAPHGRNLRGAAQARGGGWTSRRHASISCRPACGSTSTAGPTATSSLTISADGS
jgi:DNA polymerase I-like protein with 3'-5' exonuclease and polymerase domains